jgi:hypothetical protein
VDQHIIVKHYNDDLRVIDKTVRSIKEIVEATENANEILGYLNILILNSESKIKLIPNDLRDKHISELRRYQNIVNKLIVKYKQQHKKVTQKDLQTLKKLKEEKVERL